MKDIIKMDYAELSEELSRVNKEIKTIGDVSKDFLSCGLRFRKAALIVRRRDLIAEINLEADSITAIQIIRALGGLIYVKYL